MLSRVANSIYWMNRYLERAENYARFIDANLNLTLDLPPGMAEQLKPALQPLTGMKGWMEVGFDGRLRKGEISVPPGLDNTASQTLEALKMSLSQLTVPFPQKAVGQGAQWKVTSNLEQSGLPIENQIYYTLLSRSGNKLKMKVKLQQRATSKTLNLPQLPPGTTAELNQFDSSGSGNVTHDLSRVAPSQSTMQSSSNIDTNITAKGKSQNLRMKMGLNLTIQGL